MDRHEDEATDGSLYDTAPPEDDVRLSAAQIWKRRITGKVSAAILPIVQKVARPYIGGETINDAMCVTERFTAEGFTTTLGYWDAGRETCREVADSYLDLLQRLSARNLDCYVSLKPPSLQFSTAVAGELATAATAHRLRLHCDSHGPAVADLSNTMLEAMIGKLGGQRLGTTLPGRWARSLRDADWAVARGLAVRVVKGQWPDPADPKRDMAAGFLEVIDRLAGRARHVAVATHDLPLASEALARLRAAGTPCELELLLGMPVKPLIAWANTNGFKVRIYVPFGAGFIPNALGVLKRNPRLFLAFAKARLTSAGNVARPVSA